MIIYLSLPCQPPAVDLVNSVDGIVASTGDTTQGLASTTISEPVPLPLLTSPSPLCTPSGTSPLPLPAPNLSTNCYDEWIHVDVPPDNPSPTPGIGEQVQQYWLTSYIRVFSFDSIVLVMLLFCLHRFMWRSYMSCAQTHRENT